MYIPVFSLLKLEIKILIAPKAYLSRSNDAFAFCLSASLEISGSVSCLAVLDNKASTPFIRLSLLER